MSAALKAEYAASLSGRADAIDAARKESRDGHRARTTLENIYSAVHGIAGSGGVFGFHDLSRNAEVAERLIKAALADFAKFDVGEEKELVHALDLLIDCLRKTR